MYPPHLNVPLPDPSPLAPEQPDRMQQALSLITPLFALGTALGGSPQAGASFLHGAHQTLQRQDQEKQVKAHQQQQLAIQQQQMQATEQYRQQQEQAKREAIAQKLVMDSAPLLRTAKTREEYESILQQQESIGAMFVGMRPNTIRAAVPYHAPNANDVMAQAGIAFLKNPANAAAIKAGKINGVALVDVQGDGKPINVPVRDLIKAAGGQFDPQTGVPIMPADEKKPTGVQLDDEAFLGAVARFEAEKGRPATQKERGEMALAVRKQIGDAGRAPAQSININLPGMSPEERVKSAAAAILEHRLAPSQVSQLFGGGMGKEAAAFKQAVTAEVMRQNPTFNFQESESNYVFGKSAGTQNTVRFLDNITKTLPRLRAASSDFKRGNVRMINGALIAGKRQFGNTKVATFDTDRLILADEIAKVLQGGGTGSGTSDAKLKQASDLLRGDMSVGQFDATLNEIEELLTTRRGTLTKGTYMQQPDADGPVEVWVQGPNGKLVKKGGG